MTMSLFKDEVKTAISSAYFNEDRRSLISIPYTRISQVRTGPYVNVKGLVLYTSGLRTWRNYYGFGDKLYFDIADESGSIIRVFAWLDAADAAAKLIKPGQTVGLTNLAVRFKRPLYNNLDHPYELELKDISQVKLLKNYFSEGIRYFPYFLPFEDVLDKYYRLTGRTVDFAPSSLIPWNDHLSLWPFHPFFNDKHFPLFRFGKRWSVIRDKWINEWDRIKLERHVTY